MPHSAEAFAAGEITSDHVDLLAAAKASGARQPLPATKRNWSSCARRRGTPTPCGRSTTGSYRVDDESAEDEAERVRQGRHLSVGTGWRGEVVLKGVLDPVGGAVFEEELHRLCEQLRLQDERDGTIRTVQQRRADALVEMAMRSATAPADGLRPRPLFTVMIGIEPFTKLCELANGTVVAPASSSRC